MTDHDSAGRTQWRLAGGVARPGRAAGWRAARAAFEALEVRALLSAGITDEHGHTAEIVHLPPQYSLLNPDGCLSAPAPGKPLDVALRYLADHAAEWGATPADL